MTIEFRNNGMEIFNDGIMVHSHYSNKVILPGQVKSSIRRNIDHKMPPFDREKLIRQGGAGKGQLDAYLDTYVSDLQDVLLAEADKHRAALSYERMITRERQLDVILNGLPLTVDNEVTDEFGNITIEQIRNPLREGFEKGHVMLDGLPLQIEEQLYDREGNPTKTQMIDNPERTKTLGEHVTVNAGLDKTEAKTDVMAVVAARAANA